VGSLRAKLAELVGRWVEVWIADGSGQPFAGTLAPMMPPSQTNSELSFGQPPVEYIELLHDLQTAPTIIAVAAIAAVRVSPKGE